MKQMQILITIVVILLVAWFAWWVFHFQNVSKNPNSNNQSEYKNSSFGLSFNYPSNWKLQTAGEDGKNFEIIITAPEFDTHPIGKKISINITQIKTGEPDTILIPECPKNREAGTLTINNKDYIRCDAGSGLHLFKLNFKEKNSLGNTLFFSISYQSTGQTIQDTQIIENIVKSIKF